MAFPFGGHPRFQEYLEWARETEGCTYKSGFAKVDGKIETFVIIENPLNGRHVHYYMSFTEYLSPSAVTGLDRRLGLDSPFPKTVTYS